MHLTIPPSLRPSVHTSIHPSTRSFVHPPVPPACAVPSSWTPPCHACPPASTARLGHSQEPLARVRSMGKKKACTIHVYNHPRKHSAPDGQHGQGRHLEQAASSSSDASSNEEGHHKHNRRHQPCHRQCRPIFRRPSHSMSAETIYLNLWPQRQPIIASHKKTCCAT